MKDYIGQLGISAALLGVLIEAETVSGLIPMYCKPGKNLTGSEAICSVCE